MRFKLEINMDNAAFDRTNPGKELSRLLSDIALLMNWQFLPDFQRSCYDINGNEIGRYAVTSRRRKPKA